MSQEHKSEKINEKSLKEQIVDKMISELKASKFFSDALLEKFEELDLSSKNDVKIAISKLKEKKENEDT